MFDIARVSTSCIACHCQASTFAHHHSSLTGITPYRTAASRTIRRPPFTPAVLLRASQGRHPAVLAVPSFPALSLLPYAVC